MLVYRLLRWRESPLFPLSPSLLILQVDNNSGSISVAISFLTVANIFFSYFSLSMTIAFPYTFFFPIYISSLYPRHCMINTFIISTTSRLLGNAYVSLYHQEVGDWFQSRYKDKGTKIGNRFSMLYIQHLRPIFHVSYWYKVNFLR